MSARDLALELYEWGRRNGYLAEAGTVPTGDPQSLRQIVDGNPGEIEETEVRLSKAKLVGIIADEEHDTISVLTRGALGPRVIKPFPSEIKGTRVDYIGGADIRTNPPKSVPLAGNLPSPPYQIYNSRIACGSSVSSAPVFGAGTLGCLVKKADSTLLGLTNNHVTGDCNHTPKGMHIMSPAPIDADPVGPAPTAIGTHDSFVPLRSGDPQQVSEQKLDVALFAISDPSLVTSMQGAGAYDTPISVAPLNSGMPVKKIGRTTSLTRGKVIGPWVTPVAIPYQSSLFRALVHFTGAWAVQSTDGHQFSDAGDSGSLIVSEDGKGAVGLVFAGGGDVTLMMPIQDVLNALSVSLVSRHNV